MSQQRFGVLVAFLYDGEMEGRGLVNVVAVLVKVPFFLLKDEI